MRICGISGGSVRLGGNTSEKFIRLLCFYENIRAHLSDDPEKIHRFGGKRKLSSIGSIVDMQSVAADNTKLGFRHYIGKN